MKILTTHIRLQPMFPDHSFKRDFLLIAILIFFGTFLFAFIFEPFQVNKSEHNYPYSLICFSWAAISLFAYLAVSYMRRIFLLKSKLFRYDLFWFTLLLFIIGLMNYSIRPFIYHMPDNLSGDYLSEEMIHAFLFGVLMLTFIQMIMTITQSQTLHTPRIRLEETNDVIKIDTALKAESINIEPDKFVCAESDGNYLTVYTFNSSQLTKTLIRLTISDFEKNFSSHQTILRVHRSYIINMRHIQRVNGNSRGYMLLLSAMQDPVPVSRTHSSHFSEQYKTYLSRLSQD
ncbi:MAG: LytR/AlgR family response regulator transcription factor [Bacteroidales bacterium]